MRRSSGVAADPAALPGEYEYESHPTLNNKFDCMTPHEIFYETDLSLLRACFLSLNGLQKDTRLVYQLRREDMPFLELDSEDEDNLPPDCIKNLLPKIPVPREIFFQSDEEGLLTSYGARLPVTSDETLAIKSFFRTFQISIDVPFSAVPKDDEEMQHLLTAWAITPYFDPDKKFIEAHILPENISRKCMGEKNLFKPGSVLPPHWPE